jgi:hypothetical protein
MNKLFCFITLLLAFTVISEQNQAQVIKVGTGAELRSDPPAGLIAKATYRMDFIHENLRTSADLMVIPELEANLDIHYSFFSNFGLNAYGLGGVNVGSTFGANVGAGLMYGFTERIYGFWESKYIIRSINPEASIKIGVLVNL